MMRFNHIKRFLSMALLLTFMTPSCIAEMYNQSSVNDSLPLTADVMLTENNDRITLSLRESDVKQVLRMFADKAGLNIVFHDSVRGKVTLDLVDMPINDAFSLVLQVAGLNYYTQNNTLIVLSKNSAENATFSKQEMMVFPVNYVDASKIASFLNSNVFGMKKAGLSSVDAATVNTATNEIIVFGMKTDADIVQKVINQLDREPLSKTFVVNHTTPAEMANMICQILLPSGGSNMGSDSSFNKVDPNGNTTTSIKVGEGVVACSVGAKDSNVVASASPFNIQNLSVSYFPQRGTVMLTGGSAAQIEMVDKFIKKNDVKQQQAFLEISIIELNEEGSKEISNVWSLDSKNWVFKFDAGKSTVGRQAGQQFATITRPSEDGKTMETIYVPKTHSAYISWQLSYLIENRKARVLSNPKLMITSGQESVIDLTQDYVEKVTSEYMQSTANGQGASGSVQKTYTIGDDQGIKVSLIPFISPDGYVTMNIKPEYSTIADQVTSPSEADPNVKDVQATLLSRRNLDLKNVRIKDGETLAIGGLIQENDLKTVQKIPVLGDLPVVGTLFRSSSTRKVKTELLFLITPNIIKDSEDSVADNL